MSCWCSGSPGKGDVGEAKKSSRNVRNDPVRAYRLEEFAWLASERWQDFSAIKEKINTERGCLNCRLGIRKIRCFRERRGAI
jgi:hypothetical protein